MVRAKIVDDSIVVALIPERNANYVSRCVGELLKSDVVWILIISNGTDERSLGDHFVINIHAVVHWLGHFPRASHGDLYFALRTTVNYFDCVVPICPNKETAAASNRE